MTQAGDWSITSHLTNVVRSLSERRGPVHLAPFSPEFRAPTIGANTLSAPTQVKIPADMDFLWCGLAYGRTNAGAGSYGTLIGTAFAWRCRVDRTGRFLGKGSGAGAGAGADTEGWVTPYPQQINSAAVQGADGRKPWMFSWPLLLLAADTLTWHVRRGTGPGTTSAVFTLIGFSVRPTARERQ